MEENLKYQYWLKSIPGVGNKKQRKLVEYCGSAKEVYGLKESQLRRVKGIYEKDVEEIIKSRQSWDLEKGIEILEKTKISMITLEDENYPQRLRHLSDCPYGLFYKGKLPSQTKKLAAIVGARLCSSYGRAVALELGKKLAACNVGIVSGMAAGIDSFGHWGAIQGNGETYAVLGCGADVCYPYKAVELYERIQDSGGILSEYLPKTNPSPYQFPARNRLISALSDIVIVVEAKKKSGSFITIDFALEQGKEIYAVPGRLDDVLSWGCNELIRQGAGVITNVDEFILELGLKQKESETENEKIKNLLEKEESLVYSCFDLHTRNMEELIQMTGITPSCMGDLLVRLQAKGLIEEHFKNHYRKK